MLEGAQVEGSSRGAWRPLIGGINLGFMGVISAGFGAMTVASTALAAGPVGALIAGAVPFVAQGIVNWVTLEPLTKQEALDTAAGLTDRVLPQKSELNGLDKAWRGAAGDVIGAAGGGFVGLKEGFFQGRRWGAQFVDGVENTLKGKS